LACCSGIALSLKGGASHQAFRENMRRRVDYYFSLISPWSYIGHRAFAAVAKKHDLDVRYRPMALQEVFPQSGGLPLGKRHPLRQNYRMMELQRWRERRKLAMNLHPKFWPFDPSLVDRTVVALADAGAPVEAFLPRAFVGVFEKEENLADEAVIAGLLQAAGIDAADIVQRAKSDACGTIYAANAAEALAMGVFGAPGFVLDGEVFWGQDRIDFLDDALTSGRAAFHANV
jgi:2-hydroxychromene-2-carboxylate isomerase